MATPTGNACPSGTFSKFGPTITFTLNSDSYKNLASGANTNLPMNFAWAPRTTDPEFQDSFSGTLKQDPAKSTVRYLNRIYSLESIQFTTPTHSSWVIPVTSQSAVKEELVLTFRTADMIVDQTPNTIALVVPIIRDDTATIEPKYLVALSLQDGTSGAISPQDLIPITGDGLYAYYTLCAQGFAAGEPAQYVQTIVFPRGLPITNARMSKIYSKLSSAIATTDKSVPTDAYKCVPLDPETNILDGKIVIDPTTGVPLSQVEADRTAVKEAATPKISLAAYSDKVKQFLSYLLAAAFILILFYIVFSGSGNIGVPGEDSAAAKGVLMKIMEVPLPLSIGIVCLFIGFLMGTFMK
jgi:hypothetical protein